MSNECLRVEGLDGVQEHRRFIPVRAEECPMSSGGERSVLSCTEVLIVGVTSESERGRGSQVSGHVWSVCVCAALLEPSQGPGELCDHVIV
jgi:hypothetical protein